MNYYKIPAVLLMLAISLRSRCSARQKKAKPGMRKELPAPSPWERLWVSVLTGEKCLTIM